MVGLGSLGLDRECSDVGEDGLEIGVQQSLDTLYVFRQLFGCAAHSLNRNLINEELGQWPR